MIVLFVGHTCSGKNTVIKELINNYPCTYKYIVSTTSREIRSSEGEIEGNPYSYVSIEEFVEKIEKGEFIEYELIHRNYYGLDKDTIEDIINSKDEDEDEVIYLKDIGVLGAVKLKELYGDKILTVFVDVENLDLIEERLRLRGCSEEEIKLRLDRVSFERGFINYMDKYIVNNDLEEVVLNLDLDIIGHYSKINN